MSELHTLFDASNRLIRTVDALPDDHYNTPSLLPGWSRAHVIAHLALNAEGLAGGLMGVVTGEPIPMYASDEARDADIDELASATPSALRSRLLSGVSEFAEARGSVPAEFSDRSFPRTPGGRTMQVSNTEWMREREVEIHHVDLDLAYERHDWPTEFAQRAIDSLLPRAKEAFTLQATDQDHSWPSPVGAGQTTISGHTSDLAWWLTGRQDEGTLTSSNGVLPRIEAW